MLAHLCKPACSGMGNSVVSSTPTIQKDTQPKGNVDALSDLPTALQPSYEVILP